MPLPYVLPQAQAAAPVKQPAGGCCSTPLLLPQHAANIVAAFAAAESTSTARPDLLEHHPTQQGQVLHEVGCSNCNTSDAAAVAAAAGLSTALESQSDLHADAMQ